MTEVPALARFSRATRIENLMRVAVVGAGDQPPFPGLAALFPHLCFECVGPTWPDRGAGDYDVLIASVNGASPSEVDAAARRLRATPSNVRVIVALQHAEVGVTRLLLREGAADVLTAPVSDTALAVTLDKLLGPVKASARSPGGQLVCVLKAGGGVGATALSVQAAAMIAATGAGACLVDADVQFGAASLYLDMPDSATVSDCLSSNANLAQVDFKSLLSKHRSGLSLLAAPRQITPLEALSPAQAEGLLTALKASYDFVLVDMPSVWTAWTNRALQLADRIIVVTQLTVPHLHMLERQLTTLRTQGLDERSVALVCNALSQDQTALLSLKSAERALGRGFDVIVPEDRKLMLAAINQGVELASLRRGAKIEKAIGDLARLLAPQTATIEPAKTRRWG